MAGGLHGGGMHGRGHVYWGGMCGEVHVWGMCGGKGVCVQERRPLKFAVRTLLEFILVLQYVSLAFVRVKLYINFL